MATTLLLDRSIWDLLLTSEGNIALADEPYAIAQDVASAVRTFLGEVYYNTSLGLPYFQLLIGSSPILGLIKGQVIKAALTVPDVVSAKCLIADFNKQTRVVTGVIEITDVNSRTLTVTF